MFDRSWKNLKRFLRRKFKVPAMKWLVKCIDLKIQVAASNLLLLRSLSMQTEVKKIKH